LFANPYQLFFEQFGIRSCILNSELPINSRIRVIEEFNKGIYDIIIASDEKSEIFGDETAEEGEGNVQDKANSKKSGKTDAEQEGSQPKKKRKTQKQDQEYGVSRGKPRDLGL